MDGKAVTFELLGTNEQEVAYLAGFFDGEGCITITPLGRPGTGSYGLHLSLSNFFPQPLYLCRRIFGGAMTLDKRRGNRSPIHRWHLAGSKAQLFLSVVLPYLIIKKQEATLALSFRSFIKIRSPRKDEIVSEIKALKSRNRILNPGEPNTHST